MTKYMKGTQTRKNHQNASIIRVIFKILANFLLGCNKQRLPGIIITWMPTKEMQVPWTTKGKLISKVEIASVELWRSKKSMSEW